MFFLFLLRLFIYIAPKICKYGFVYIFNQMHEQYRLCWFRSLSSSFCLILCLVQVKIFFFSSVEICSLYVVTIRLIILNKIKMTRCPTCPLVHSPNNLFKPSHIWSLNNRISVQSSFWFIDKQLLSKVVG